MRHTKGPTAAPTVPWPIHYNIVTCHIDYHISKAFLRVKRQPVIYSVHHDKSNTLCGYRLPSPPNARHVWNHAKICSDERCLAGSAAQAPIPFCATSKSFDKCRIWLLSFLILLYGTHPYASSCRSNLAWTNSPESRYFGLISEPLLTVSSENCIYHNV